MSTSTPRTAPRRRSAARAGFTLIEMMVALTIGAMVIATVYTIGASAARHFQEQQRISQLQLGVRLALDRIRRDVSRAGFLATMSSAGDVPCGPPPLGQIRGLNVVDRSPTSRAALERMTGWSPPVSHGDTLDITGNFRTGDAYVVREWQGLNLQLGTQFMSYRRSFTANPADPTFSVDTALVGEVFRPGTPIMARIGNMRAWTRVESVTADTIGTRATLTTSNTLACAGQGGMEGWAQGGVTIAPVALVRYEIVDAADAYLGRPAVAGLAPRNLEVTGRNTVLMRTELDPLNPANVIDGPSPVLEYAVHFDVDVFADMAVGANPAQHRLLDDAAAAARTAANPATIRGVRISLAARTPEQDPRLTDQMPALGDGTPRVFRVFAAPRVGGARVRSAYTEVFLPNSGLR
jgi:prepilin-type N-terminal cleavage/methylation domain-containing protein